MDTQEPQRLREKEEEDKAPPPPSSSASLSDEFSFATSLHPPLNTAPNTLKSHRSTSTVALDMAAADDLFFHGHLLPLHLMAPRPSDFSAESFSLPKLNYQRDDTHKNSGENKERVKASSMTLSSFFGLGKPRKGGDDREREEDTRRRRKRGFDMSRLLKKYTRVMEHLFFSKGEKKKRDQRRSLCTFSGHSNHRGEREWWRKKGQLSAPASTMASPRNSGLLSASAIAFSSPNDSSMEELQSAIQAAIAHCKKSVAMEEERCKS
ncbi:unnamed protein product [Musa acuminata subsp. malaccensis]|uniref:(wild Malaysian banana) hypothetical protein n=1 Tax=Musa acuminata subsp. malaccensis TaxID=214687 RepID=A0A804J8F4_MUSAM|nr:PREDICTED: BRI1 kinase inhibitor 1-like [Musa acuminata subsp. malaccensis]CAG1839580.1 unnamed protein product [Musa acuminata subsp. malaccensis]